MIDWKRHAKRFYMNWKYSDDLAMAHYGRYRKMKDRAQRAEARVAELEKAILDELSNELRNNGIT